MKKRDKLEEEIEEILSVSEKRATGRNFEKSIRRSIPFLKTPSVGRWRSISPLTVVIVGTVLIISGMLGGGFKTTISSMLGWSGLVLFILAYFLFLLRSNRPRDKRWRGRSIKQ